MKIALVSAYDFAHPGGVVDHIRHLAAHQQRLGHQVRIIAPWSGPPAAIPRGVPFSGVGSVVPVPANGSVARITLSPTVSQRVQQILRAEQFDIVHLHEPLLPALPLTVLLHSTAVNVGTFHAYRQSNLAYFYARPVLRRFFRRLHGRIAVSTSVLSFISKDFDADYAVIPNGIETTRFGDATPLPALRDGRPTILFVGRFNEPRKGFRHLLQALPRVRAAVPTVRLIVVGRGDQEQFRPLLTTQTDGDVIFAGCVSDADLPRYYASCDVFCAPSTGRESFGIVLLEAMAAGRPVVASDIPGYAGVVHDGREGLLVARTEPAALAAALVRLLTDADLRARFGQQGRRTAGAYDWDSVSRRVLRYYTEVAVPEQRLLRGVR